MKKLDIESLIISAKEFCKIESEIERKELFRVTVEKLLVLL